MKLSIDQQVCTLEQAKKLTEIGLSKVGSIFYYFRDTSLPDGEFIIIYSQSGPPVHLPKESELYPAFNVMELGHMLLECQFSCGSYYSDHLGYWLWQMLEYNEEGELSFKVAISASGEFETEAEARADMLIFCLESKLISVQGVNEQLV